MSSRAFPVVVAAVAIAWLVNLAVGTPWLILGGAFAPAALYVLAIVVLQRGAGRPSAELALAFLWGAVGASFISTTLNVFLRGWIGGLAGSDEARTITATLLAPGIEEAAKALGFSALIAIRPASIRSVRDGIVYGALIGVGFVFTENLLYLGYAVLQGGEAGLVRAAYLRGLVFGATHAVFTASVGAGMGWFRAARASYAEDASEDGSSARLDVDEFDVTPNDTEPDGASPRASLSRLAIVPVSGFVAAVAQHAAWNTGASDLVNRALCAAETVGAACRDVPPASALWGWAPLWAAVFLAPGCVALWLASREAPHQSA